MCELVFIQSEGCCNQDCVDSEAALNGSSGTNSCDDCNPLGRGVTIIVTNNTKILLKKYNNHIHLWSVLVCLMTPKLGSEQVPEQRKEFLQATFWRKKNTSVSCQTTTENLIKSHSKHWVWGTTIDTVKQRNGPKTLQENYQGCTINWIFSNVIRSLHDFSNFD